MQTTRGLLLFIFFISSCQFAVGQDTLTTQRDSAYIYKKIETYSQKRKFTKFLSGLIFEPLTPKTISARKKVQRKRFRAFHGKIVRHINITTLDPFGYSESDTTSKPQQKAAKIGNALHLKTKKLAIKNLLLIKRNKPLDSLLVKESERLIRSQRYVRRVIITPIKVSKDSVDVDIRVLDSWSLIPDFSASSSRASYMLTERNFLGLGHQFSNTYMRELGTSNYAYSTRYTVPNIMNTYIRTTLNYQVDLENNYNKGITIERPFFSPYARWAAGIKIDQDFRRDTIPDVNFNYARENFKVNTTDFYGAHSQQLIKGDSEDDRTTNFITAARFVKYNYRESPRQAYDSINFYSNEQSWLFGVGVSSRQFIEDKYIFDYGIIEDVPVGKAFGITSGWQDKNLKRRLYLGARFALGKYYTWGYLSSNIEYGSYYNGNVSEQSAVSFQSNYFTNLYEKGRWKFRQFFKAQLIIGGDRQMSNGDFLTINESEGLTGFRSENYGSKKMVLSAQTQSYSPWNLWGFRLNPYLNYTVGMLAKDNGFSNTKTFSQLSVGFIVSNDFLVFSTFQISMSYYPTIPNEGNNIFKSNAFNTEDFGFQDFELSKPRTVLYN